MARPWLAPEPLATRRLARAFVPPLGHATPAMISELVLVGARRAILRTVMVVSGWRALIWLLAGMVVAALLLTFVVWLAVLVAVIAAMAWLNLVVLPRVSTRLRMPYVVVAVVLLPLLAASGLLLGGLSGVVAGASAWLLGVALPQALLLRLRTHLRRASWRAPSSGRGVWLVPMREMSPGLRRPG